MRKYKQAIQIGDNITDIFNLPCIWSVDKEKRLLSLKGHGNFKEYNIPLYITYNGTKANIGDWLLEDVCGNWHVMTDEEYQKHKDDEI